MLTLYTHRVRGQEVQASRPDGTQITLRLASSHINDVLLTALRAVEAADGVWASEDGVQT